MAGHWFLHEFYGAEFPNYVNSIMFAFASAYGKASEMWLLAMSQLPPTPAFISMWGCLFVFYYFTELVTYSQSIAFTDLWLCVRLLS